MRKKVTKAVFPVAGMGTRFLPATKSVPKEIMTLVDRPLVQYAIDEARAAGIKEFIFVTSRGKGALEDYFDHAPQLEQELRKKGKTELLETLQSTNMDSGAIAYIRQHKALGLGHAVWCARRLIGNEPFAVMLPDDVIAAEKPCLKQMVEAYEEVGGNLISVLEVPHDEVSSYGVIAPGAQLSETLTEVTGLVEKPPVDEAPSNKIISGRYILQPEVMGVLKDQGKGAGGEIQLTDAMAKMIGNQPFHAATFAGRRFDCGSKTGFVEATLALALEREDMGVEVRAMAQRLLAE